MKLLFCLLSLGLVGACSKPPQNAALSPDGSAWIEIHTLEADQAQDRWVPTQSATLHQRWSTSSLLLVEGVENFCGLRMDWAGPQALKLRVPVGAQGKLKVVNGQDWGGIQLGVEFHEDQVLMQRVSEDMQYRLVVLSACDTEDWNLYLRRAGEPLYNDAMNDGWEDPNVFGGFGYEQKPISLEWTGPRSARIEVPGKQYKVTLRDKIGDVTLKWVFNTKFKPKEPELKTLEPIKAAP